MRFAFSDDQLLLQSTVRDFLAQGVHARSACARSGRARAVTTPCCGASSRSSACRALLVPDAHGGMGLDERDLVLLLEETGRAALPAPVVATAAVGAPLLRDAGNAALAERVAAARRGGRRDPRRRPSREPVRHRRGRRRSVAARARRRTARDRAQRRDARRTSPRTIPARRLFGVAWTPSATTRIATGDDRARVARRGARPRRARVRRAGDRRRGPAARDRRARTPASASSSAAPIGSFQALQHKLADAKVKLEYARPVVYKAAHAVALDSARARRSTSRTRRSPRPKRPRSRRAPRCRCTARSATPGSRICTCGCGARGRSSASSATRRSIWIACPRFVLADRRADRTGQYLLDFPIGGRNGGGLHHRRRPNARGQARRLALDGPLRRPRRARAEGIDGAHGRRSRRRRGRDLRLLRHDRVAVRRHRAHLLARGGSARARARRDDRPPVRLVAAIGALRRAGRDERHQRSGRRGRRAEHERDPDLVGDDARAAARLPGSVQRLEGLGRALRRGRGVAVQAAPR